jgi:hypothetical protein
MKRAFAILGAVGLLLVCGADKAPQPLRIADINGNVCEPLNPGESRANVLFFVRTDCPISNGYAPEISRIEQQYGPEKINFYLVYAMRDLSDAAAHGHMKEYKLTGPAIIDRKHELVKAVGATVTVEAAVVGRDGKLIYLGRIDDQYAGLGKPRTVVTTHELRDALDAVVEGKEPKVSRKKAVGCAITED